MSWRDRMATAIFRGVSFLTDSHDAKLGRRLVVHEFPGAELPQIEDLGAKAAELRVNAYFLGENYDQDRDQFLYLLQQPGAAILLHPWLGGLEVRAKDWTLTESNDKGGYCAISIDFVPAGAVITAPKIDPTDTASGQLNALADAADGEFSLLDMSTDAIQSFVATAYDKLNTLQNIISIAKAPLNAVAQVTRLITDIKSDLTDLVSLPYLYMGAMRSLFTSVTTLGIDLPSFDTPRLVAHLCHLATRYPLNGAVLNQTVSPTSALELPINLQKDTALQACCLIAAAGELALIDYASTAQRDAVQTALVSAIDAIAQHLPDPVFMVAMNARAALIEALSALVIDPTQTLDILEPMPAAALAYQLDINEADFLAINGISHPLFVRGVVYG